MKEQHRSILDEASEAVFRTSTAGAFIAANAAMASILGYSRTRDMLRGAAGISRKLYLNTENHDRMRRSADRPGPVEGFESRMRRRDGSHIRVAVAVRAVPDDQGDLLYYAGTLRRIPEPA